MITKKNYRSYVFGALFLIGLSLAVGYFHIFHGCQNPILLPYDQTRDRQFILDSFKNDWHWLVSEYSPNFSPEYMLDHKASSQRPEHLGNLTVKTLYTCDEPAGFVAYYRKTINLGYVLFIDIVEKFRKKGYAYIMLSNAVTDLHKRGCDHIQLITRTTNFTAQKLYTRFGFREIERDEGFITYEYRF